MRVAILSSGEGTTLQAIVDATRGDAVRAQVVLVISNNAESGALCRARAAGIVCEHLSARTHPDPAALDAAICSALVVAEADIVVLAGYMKKIGPAVLARYANRILNTHPALLPRHGGHGMYGRRVHEAVLASGDVQTGISVHLVDGEYDTGRVIAQLALPVRPGETVEMLEGRVREAEKSFLVATLQRIATGSLSLEPG